VDIPRARDVAQHLPSMARDRLSPLDRSFLHVESPTAHMHVAARARFVPDPAAPAVTLERLRDLVRSRLHASPRFRQRLAFPPGGMSAPVWVDDPTFDLDRHVVGMSAEEEPLSRARFAALSDAVLSEPLDRAHPLWRIHVAPWLEDGTVGLVLKAHHAMVDGLGALALGLLLLDVRPDAPEPDEPPEWTPEPPPGSVRLAVDALAGYGAESLRAARELTKAIGTGRRIGDTVRRTALAIESDVLRSAPSSYLNAEISPSRRLAGHRAPIADLLAVKAARGTTLNDVALTVVCGALRQLALTRGTVPTPLKAMVPVNRRTADDDTPGNKIAFVSVSLPLNVRAPLKRLDDIAAQTRAFKAAQRASGSEALLGAVGLLPPLLQDAAARFAASARAYNLVVSNVPGPRVPVYLLGARCVEAYPVIPLSDGHALSVGMLSLSDALCVSAYWDPEALPEGEQLAGAIAQSTLELMRASSRRASRAA
jgi:WS/DGAT/MGAT family acyltransferase